MPAHRPGPDLFDPALLVTRRDRAARGAFRDGADFLHRAAADLLADRLAEINRPFPEAAVIGSGGGAYARALAAPGREILQIEPAPAMARLAGAAEAAPLDPLGLAPESRDLVVSGLWLHWANDPVGQLVQMRRTLRPDGLMIALLFSGQTLVELRSALATAEAEVTGGLSPRVAPMGEIRDLGALLQRAGFALPVADVERLSVTYADVRALMHDLRAMGETNVLTGRLRHPTRRQVFARAEEIYAAAFPAPDGRIHATFEIAFLTGWAPAADQPRPRRPGSASRRLADALGTVEKTTGDKATPGRG